MEAFPLNGTKREETYGNPTKTHRRDRNSAGSENHAHRMATAEGNPCLYRPAHHVKPVA